MDNTTDTTDTSTAASSTFTPIYDGATVSYQSTANPGTWHQTVELVFICIMLGLSIILLVGRTVLKFRRNRSLRFDDGWILLSGIFVGLLWISQIGTNRNGNGLHELSLTDDQFAMWYNWTWGWFAYYFAVTFLKLAVCFSFLQIMPTTSLRRIRITVYILCAIIFVHGMMMSFMLLFPCVPLKANFNPTLYGGTCLNTDALRYAWIGCSIIFDLCICVIPLLVLRETHFREKEKIILLLVFTSTLLGTAACAADTYAAYETRYTNVKADVTWLFTVWVLFNDLEILMYSIGAFLPLTSPDLITKLNRNHGESKKTFVTAKTSDGISVETRLNQTNMTNTNFSTVTRTVYT